MIPCVTNKMLLGHIKFILRNLRHNRTWTILNIVGLTIAISSVLLITLLVHHEFSFDKNFDNYQQVYRVTTIRNSEQFANCPQAVADILFQQSISGLTGARLKKIFRLVTKADNQLFLEDGAAWYADQDIDKILPISFQHGCENFDSIKPNQIALSTAAAMKYFSTTEAIGHLLEFNDQQWTVAAVFTNIINSHLPPLNILIPWPDNRITNNLNWDEWQPTYLKLSSGLTRAATEEYLNQIAADQNLEFRLQPVSNIHLSEALIGDYALMADSRQLFIFISVALIILIIACLNYANFSLARTKQLARQAIIRKVTGATRLQLVQAGLLETIIIGLMALLLSYTVVESSLAWFNGFLGKPVVFSFNSPALLVMQLIILLVIITVGGLYPAWNLSRQNFSTLRNQTGITTQKSGWSRYFNFLVIGQFVVTYIILSTTLAIDRQIRYIGNYNPGFRPEQLLAIPTVDGDEARFLGQNLAAIKAAMLSQPGVMSVTGHLTTPNRSWRSDWFRLTEQEFEPNQPFIIEFTDHDYLRTYDLVLVNGRNFSKVNSANQIIINETAATALGFNTIADAIGQHLSNWLGNLEIIGIVRDFNSRSLHNRIEPLILMSPPNLFPEMLTIRISGEQPAVVIARIAQAWKSILPDYPFNYFFVDADMNDYYHSDHLLARTMKLFSWLALCIATLGLIGTAVFHTERRIKEIGIRKVMGASISEIVLLFWSQYLLWLLTAFIIALPIAVLIINDWLNQFAYHTRLSAIIFIITGLVILLVAMVTTGVRVVKSGSANPVDSLRYE